MLADLINRLHPKWIIKYHVHDSLLQNIEEETLTQEEMKAAWDAYEAEKNNVKTAPGKFSQIYCHFSIFYSSIQDLCLSFGNYCMLQRENGGDNFTDNSYIRFVCQKAI